MIRVKDVIDYLSELDQNIILVKFVDRMPNYKPVNDINQILNLHKKTEYDEIIGCPNEDKFLIV